MCVYGHLQSKKKIPIEGREPRSGGPHQGFRSKVSISKESKQAGGSACERQHVPSREELTTTHKLQKQCSLRGPDEVMIARPNDETARDIRMTYTHSVGTDRWAGHVDLS